MVGGVRVTCFGACVHVMCVGARVLRVGRVVRYIESEGEVHGMVMLQLCCVLPLHVYSHD